MKTFLKLSLLAFVLFAPCLAAAPARTVTFLGQEWHYNAARVGKARGEAEFLRTPEGVAHLEKLTAVDADLNDLYAEYVNISRVDPESEEGKRLRQERQGKLKVLSERKKDIDGDFAKLKETSPKYREIMLRNLQRCEKRERTREAKNKALQEAKAGRK